MTAASCSQPDPDTRAALDVLRNWVPADTLLNRLERQLRAAGADFDTIDQHLADELGVTATDWHGYHAVRRAADRYQHPRQPQPSDEGAPLG